MSASGGRRRRFQQIGPEALRMGRLGATAATLVLVLVVTVSPALAGHPPQAHAGATTADALVAKLRELPMPMQRSPQGLGPTNATPPPLPALESKRQQVYDELHSLGPQSVPALARALRDPDPEMRRDVAVALDVVGGGWWHFPDWRPKLDLRPALPALLAALRDSDPGVRAWVAQDISDIGSGAAPAVPHLRAMLHSTNAESRGTACNALGAIGSAARAALPDLQRALGDPSPEVRLAARAAIARIGRSAPTP
ncbi:MAG TPA: HEAT repeat domain-containing protein [Steroidobacteraceae bacterium]